MRSGDLKTIVTIYRKTEITSEYGEKSFVYNKYKVTRGNVNKLPRNRADIDSKATYMMDLSITIWAYVDINEDDVVKVNNNKYFVNKINNDLDRNFKTLDLIDIDDTTVVTDEDAPKDMYTITTASNFDYMGYTTGSTRDYEGTQITISATAFSGYIFDHWDDDNTDNPRTIEIVRNAKYTAIFKAYTPDTPAGRVISKMQEEQPALYDALTMWFDPKMEGITQADIANWFDYPDNIGTLNWNLTSYKKAMTNLSGKSGDLYMISQSKDIPLPTVMEDGRIKMNDGKCSMVVDQLKTKRDYDTVFWYMNYELSDDYLQSASTASITFCPWIGSNYLYITDIDANAGLSVATAGLSITYIRTATDTDEYIYQYPRVYGLCNTTAPNTITISATTSTDNKNYVKANLPNRPCWTTRYKNSTSSVDYDRRKWSCCWGNNNGELDLHTHQKTIGNSAISSTMADQLIDAPFYLSICDRKTDYNFTAGTSYRATNDCVFGWFISFNRPLTDEEIAWVEDNMYSTKLEDIPYRPYQLWQ